MNDGSMVGWLSWYRIAPIEKNRMTNGKNVGEGSLRFLLSWMRPGGSRDDKRPEIGGRKRMMATRATRDQPRSGKDKLDASRMPHRKARESQSKGMNGVYISYK